MDGSQGSGAYSADAFLKQVQYVRFIFLLKLYNFLSKLNESFGRSINSPVLNTNVNDPLWQSFWMVIELLSL